MKIKIGLVIALLGLASLSGAISQITVPYSFVPNTKAESAKVNANFTAVATGANNVIDAVNTASGTKATLAQRLAVSMNADGTFKNVSGVTAGGQWTNPGLLAVYSSSRKFYISGSDQTDIYLQYRRVKAILGASTVYSEVASSSFTGGKTVVTIADAVLTRPIATVEHSVFTPVNSNNSALSAKASTGYAATPFNTASTIVTRNAFGNFSAGKISAYINGTSAYAVSSSGLGNLPTMLYENGVRIVRGVIASSGVASYGSGFTSSNIVTGKYQIVWDNNFGGIPSIIATVKDDVTYSTTIAVDTVTVGSCYVQIHTTGGAARNNDFNFIAIGPN